MCKYITDTIKNNLKSVTNNLTKPQKKAVTEVTRGLLSEATPILRHLSQNTEITTKKQGEKYSHHLGNIELTKKVEAIAFRHAAKQLNRYTIIAYDLSDIAKPTAKKMEKLRRVFDGSKHKTGNGYTFHGVGVNQLLIRAEVHDGDKDFLPKIRENIVLETLKSIRKSGRKVCGVWIFDRGNDDKQFFTFLRSKAKVDFIARLKENRQVVIAKTGVVEKVKNLKPGQYEVFLYNRTNTKVETKFRYRLVIMRYLRSEFEPIRLLTTLPKKRFSKGQIITMYLERWGVENSFKRIKQKFGLEKIRVLKYNVLLNLIALTLFCMAISTIIFQRLQNINNELITEVLMKYKQFLKRHSLGFNLDSFISFLHKNIPLLVRRVHIPLRQMTLLLL
jgi:hypothetical protein